jgi:hypothetical protein
MLFMCFFGIAIGTGIELDGIIVLYDSNPDKNNWVNDSTFGFHEPVPPAGGLRHTQLHLSVTKTRYGRPANSLRSNSAGRCSFAASK